MLEVQVKMRAAGSPARAQHSSRFFRTGPGQYGEGDRFLGLTVPEVRAFVPQCKDLSLEQVVELLHSPWHEERLLALVLLAKRFPKDSRRIYDLYLEHIADYVNNWDLVDTSAPAIVGAFLVKQPDRSILRRLACSSNLWERRVAVVATQGLIRQNQFQDTLDLCELLLKDREDLIHKACGWMLREIGKRALSALLEFLDKWATQMPRTMLRYSLEKLDPDQRRTYMDARPANV
ncbi:MAG: DNA alkylation repair protein [Candidatus Eremiobacteraeota bacterium]|nr:DNA alkylation repair protein [Candidatus Eremiobacteraeota bacterium]MCW5870771.1 DNA alkylation repair protein [Candidatus Eremiobacteraeota bacterium]